MNQIYSRQLGFLIFLYLLGSAFIYVPESVIGKDVWAATILAALPGLYLLYILISVQMMYPGQNIIQIAELTLGKVGGKLINLIFLLNLFIIAILLLFDNIRFVQLMYPAISTIILTTTIILATAYVILKGVNVHARLADFYIWAVIVLLILGLISITPLFDFNNILPALVNIKPIVGGTVYASKWPYAEMIVIAMYLPFLTDLKENKRQLYFWFGLAALVLVIRSFLVLGILGADYLRISRFPFYDVFRLIRFQEFERLELFFFFLFINLMFTVLIFSYKALAISIKEFFNFSNTNRLIFPVGLLIIGLMYKTFPSDIRFISLNDASIFIVLPFTLLYPTIVFIAAKIKLRKQEE